MSELMEKGRRFLQNSVLEPLLRVEWPASPPPVGRPRIGIVTVNYNTAQFIAYLVFSLYRVIGSAAFQRLVVVDNGSRDGSLPLLRGLAREGLLELLENSRQRYHGPALNQGISHLASTTGGAGAVDYVWVLDSDVVVLRREVLACAVAALRSSAAAVVGELEYVTHPLGYATLHSLLMDPRQVWRDDVPPFHEHSAPGAPMQRALRARGRCVAHFPFFQDGYLLHLGSGTLHTIARRRERENRYFAWAHAWEGLGLHFGGNPQGPALHRSFVNKFRREVPILTGERLARACRSAASPTSRG